MNALPDIAAKAANAADAPIIEARNLRMTFSNGSVVALEDVNFAIRPGEFVSLIGPSGCGKSTLLRLVAGLLERSSGQLDVLGTPAGKPREEIGMMFQKPTLLAWKNVLDNVVLPNTLTTGATDDHRRKALELLRLVGLQGFEFSYPNQLSGGMQQRVALARLLHTGARILLLDEPFGALDEFTRERLNVELLRIQRDLKATMLFVTHNIQEAVFLADRVFVMTPRPGRLTEIVSVDLPRPRDITDTKTEAFNRLAFEVRDILGASI